MLSEEERGAMQRGIDALETADIHALVEEYHPAVEVDDAVEFDAPDGDTRVLCLSHFTASGAAGGARLRESWAWIWSFRDGKIARVEVYRSQDEAREAAGLGG